MMVKREAKAIHEQLNNDAVTGIIKAVESESEWELDLFEKLNKDKANSGRNAMLIPVLKNAAGRFHKVHQTLKEQALKDMREQKAVDRQDKRNGAMEPGKADGGEVPTAVNGGA